MFCRKPTLFHFHILFQICWHCEKKMLRKTTRKNDLAKLCCRKKVGVFEYGWHSSTQRMAWGHLAYYSCLKLFSIFLCHFWHFCPTTLETLGLRTIRERQTFSRYFFYIIIKFDFTNKSLLRPKIYLKNMRLMPFLGIQNKIKRSCIVIYVIN